jgi:Arc/MetJ-type ribon-helix-helix transcriptional regulator
MAKAKISVSMEVDLILWVDRLVERGVFDNRSQGIEHCVKERKSENR